MKTEMQKQALEEEILREICEPSRKSASFDGSPAYGARVNANDPGKVYLVTPGVEHGMEWWEAQNLAARLMDAAAEAVKIKGR